PVTGAAAPSGAQAAATVAQNDVQMSQPGYRGHHESDDTRESVPAESVPSERHVAGAFAREEAPVMTDREPGAQFPADKGVEKTETGE
ncbi:MAG TPA: hypothetical protein VJZ91_05130, partial [Blastocatellia bacterium]|nr:hypothetical protein [Blastocatellia bacterium]